MSKSTPNTNPRASASQPINKLDHIGTIVATVGSETITSLYNAICLTIERDEPPYAIINATFSQLYFRFEKSDPNTAKNIIHLVTALGYYLCDLTEVYYMDEEDFDKDGALKIINDLLDLINTRWYGPILISKYEALYDVR